MLSNALDTGPTDDPGVIPRGSEWSIGKSSYLIGANCGGDGDIDIGSFRSSRVGRSQWGLA